MSMMKEFKDFAMRGNVMDMAIGIILGAAFGKIVTSFVEDVIMPPIGLLLGRVDFSSLFLSLSGRHFDSVAAAKAAGAPTINIGLFLNTIVNFVIVAFAIFLVIQQMNRLMRKKETAPPPVTTKPCPYCLSDIPLAATRCAHCTSEVKAS